MRLTRGITALTAVLLAGCGSAASPPAPPSARSLMAAMRCRYLASGDHFAGQDLAQDIRIQGNAPGCLGGEIFTFPTATAQARWLHQAGSAARDQNSALYPWFAVGHLWAVELADPSVQAHVAKLLGGKPASFS